MEKIRSEGAVSGGALVGSVEGCVAVLLDDMICSGGTMTRAARACRAQGATSVLAVATHGVFTERAREHLVCDALEQVICLDTIPPFGLPDPLVERKLVQLPGAPLLAEAIRRLHGRGSHVELLEV